jgi:hypothetical protein
MVLVVLSSETPFLDEVRHEEVVRNVAVCGSHFVGRFLRQGRRPLSRSGVLRL